MSAVRASTVAGALLLLPLLNMLLSLGCVTGEATVRVVTRAGALRDAVIVPASITPGLQVAVGAEAATDPELAALEQALQEQLSGLLHEATTTTTVEHGTRARGGDLSVVRARVKASPGREQHRYLADCRLRLRVDGAVVAEAEADVVRLVRARNLSLIELEAMREQVANQGGRVPLLKSDDVNAALLEACTAAFDAVAFDIRPEDESIDDVAGPGFAAQERSLDRKDQRRRTLDKLEKNAAVRAAGTAPSSKSLNNMAGALIDLGSVGMLADAPLLARYLYDDDELLRRAAESSFASLCAGHATLAPKSTACVKPEPPPPPLPPAPIETTDDEEDDDDDAPIRQPLETPTTTDPAAAAPDAPAAAPDAADGEG